MVGKDLVDIMVSEKRAGDCSLFCLCDESEITANSCFTPNDGECSGKDYLINKDNRCSPECKFYEEVQE